MNYNTKIVDQGAIRFVFVTRARAKPFNDDEVRDFFDMPASVIPEPEVKPWKIPDTRQRSIQFLNDLKRGVIYCVKKYGVTQEQIIAEANRIAPFQQPGE